MFRYAYLVLFMYAGMALISLTSRPARTLAAEVGIPGREATVMPTGAAVKTVIPASLNEAGQPAVQPTPTPPPLDPAELAGWPLAKVEATLLAQGYVTTTHVLQQNQVSYYATIYQPTDFLESTYRPNYLLIYKSQGQQQTILLVVREEMRLTFFDYHGQGPAAPGWIEMNGDGWWELPYLRFNGGNCLGCESIQVLQLRPDDTVINLTEAVPPEDRLGNAFVVTSLTDQDGNGTLEWMVTDTRWEFTFGLCHLCSPFATRLYAWDGQVYRDASAQFAATFYQEQIERLTHSAETWVDSREPWSGDELGGLVSLLLAYENAGRGSEGWAIFEQYTDPADYINRADATALRRLVEAREIFRTWHQSPPNRPTLPAYALTLTTPQLYRDEEGGLHVVGQVTNQERAAFDLTLVAALYTADGTLLDVASRDFPLDALDPGQSRPYTFSPFHFRTIQDRPDQAALVDRAEVWLIWAEPAPIETVTLTPRGDKVERVGSAWRFSGEVVNSSGRDLFESAVVQVTLYDTTGQLLATAEKRVYGHQARMITPGEVIPYEIDLALPPGVDPTSLTSQRFAQGLVRPETRFIPWGEFEISLTSLPTEPVQTEVVVRDTYVHTEVLTLTLPNVYVDHYHPVEYHQGHLYIIRRTGYTDELWRYDATGQGQKIYQGFGPDFRVAPDESYIAIGNAGVELDIIEPTGRVVQHFDIDQLTHETGEYYAEVHGGEWSNDSRVFWGELTTVGKPQTLYRIEAESWVVERYDISALPIFWEHDLNPNTGRIVFSDYPSLITAESSEAFAASGQAVNLFVYDPTDQQVRQIDTATAKAFYPEWLNQDTIEYDDPAGQGRVRHDM